MTLPAWSPWLDDEPVVPVPEPEDPAARRDRLLNEAHAAWEQLEKEWM